MHGPLTPLLASGLFDSPWVIVGIFLVSSIANWLAKRRQEKELQQQQEAAPPTPPPAGGPPAESDLAKVLRQLMGEEPQSTPPPPRPRESSAPAPATSSWDIGDEPPQIPPSMPPPRIPPPDRVPLRPAPAPILSKSLPLSENDLPEGPEDSGWLAAAMASKMPAYGTARVRSRAQDWRGPRNARKAFVASIVFAPPKGLEP